LPISIHLGSVAIWMFVHDGQFGFSLFPFVVRAMVALWGPAMTGEVLAVVAALAWFWAGLAALAANRDVVCLCCLAAATLLHPIMALAGFGVFVAVRGREDRRWFWFCACAGALSILGGALGLPLMDRFFTAIDPSLQSLHESHNAFLFPSLWPIESYPPLIV
jgi:hypothetical protein